MPQVGDRITTPNGKTFVAVDGDDGWVRWEEVIHEPAQDEHGLNTGACTCGEAH